MWLVNALLFFNSRGGLARDSEVFHIRFWEMQPNWKTGLIKCGGHCEARCGSSDVSGGKPRPRTGHLGQKQHRRGPDFLPQLHASLSLGALPLPQASPQCLPQAPVLAPRAGPAVLALCFPVQAGSWPCQCIYPRRQPRSSCMSTGRGLCVSFCSAFGRNSSRKP